jgi:hypothetical protein
MGENGDVLAHSHNILNRWKNYCCRLLSVHNVSEVRQVEIHTGEVELVVTDFSPLSLKLLFQSLKV